MKLRRLNHTAALKSLNDWQDIDFLQNGSVTQKRAWNSLHNTMALDLLAHYNPVLTGSVPIDIDVEGSDLDIICTALDLKKFKDFITAEFSHRKNFCIQQINVNGQPTIIATFKDEYFPYEIFGQAVPVNQQNAYLHMLIESFLLGVGGDRARRTIRGMKANGIKTEPAFASYFGISGDPYKELRNFALEWVDQKIWHFGPTILPQTSSHQNAILLKEMKDFCQRVLANLKDVGMLEYAKEIDHACFRVSDTNKYEMLKAQLEQDAVLLSEAFVNGRPIASYKLKNPVDLDNKFSISVIELPAPKFGRIYEDGFEHIEVVVSVPLENFMDRFSHLEFDKSNFHASINRDVSHKLMDGLVKFHEYSLEQVIAQEQVAILRNKVEVPTVILDFDDTIAISKEPFLRAVHVALENYLQQAIDFQAIVVNARPTFPDFFANFGIHDYSSIAEVVSLFSEAWENEAHHCSVPIGMRSMLSCLKSEGVRIVVWTARDPLTTTSFLEHHQLHYYIDEVFGFDAKSNGKPIPNNELKNIASQSCGVLVGDSNSDALGALNLSLPFIQAAWVHKGSIAGSKFICESPLECLAIAMNLLKGNVKP